MGKIISSPWKSSRLLLEDFPPNVNREGIKELWVPSEGKLEYKLSKQRVYLIVFTSLK